MSDQSYETPTSDSFVEQPDFLHEQRAAWLIAAQAGDNDAKAELCMSYRQDVYAYLHSRPDTDPETVEDITQTVLLRLWLYDISHYHDDGDGLRPLAFTIAKNAWLDNRMSAYHRYSRITEDVELYGAYFPTRNIDDEEQIDTRVDGRAALQNIIGKIATYIAHEHVNPDTMKAMLLFADGYTLAEIAELQHVTITAVKQRIHRGRNQLRRLLLNDT